MDCFGGRKRKVSEHVFLVERGDLYRCLPALLFGAVFGGRCQTGFFFLSCLCAE